MKNVLFAILATIFTFFAPNATAQNKQDTNTVKMIIVEDKESFLSLFDSLIQSYTSPQPCLLYQKIDSVLVIAQGGQGAFFEWVKSPLPKVTGDSCYLYIDWPIPGESLITIGLILDKNDDTVVVNEYLINHECIFVHETNVWRGPVEQRVKIDYLKERVSSTAVYTWVFEKLAQAAQDSVVNLLGNIIHAGVKLEEKFDSTINRTWKHLQVLGKDTTLWWRDINIGKSIKIQKSGVVEKKEKVEFVVYQESPEVEIRWNLGEKSAEVQVGTKTFLFLLSEKGIWTRTSLEPIILNKSERNILQTFLRTLRESLAKD